MFYSQHREDEKLEELFNQIGIQKGRFIEFGAWDGIFMSNVYHFYEEGWDGVYIEGDSKKFADLQKNAPRAELIHAWVGFDGHGTLLDDLIKGPNRHFELLSLDIDSDDLAAFESIKTLTFTAIVIEYNPTIPIGVKFKNPIGKNVGNSSTAILNAIHERGYCLVHQTRTNLIFMSEDVIRQHHIRVIGLTPQWHLFFGYDGRMYAHNWNQIDSEPFYPLPWGLGYIAQPLPNVAIGMDSRWRNILGLLTQAPWMFIRFPASYSVALTKLVATKVTNLARRTGLIARRPERVPATTDIDAGLSTTEPRPK